MFLLVFAMHGLLKSVRFCASCQTNYQVRAYSIKGQLLNWIKDFLSNRTQHVKVNNSKSASLAFTMDNYQHAKALLQQRFADLQITSPLAVQYYKRVDTTGPFTLDPQYTI